MLDPIALIKNNQNLHSGIFGTDRNISDHFGTFTFIKIRNQPTTIFKRWAWNYKRVDFGELNKKIHATDWSFLQNSNINYVARDFTNKFLELAASCKPNNLVIIRPNDRPLYNSEIRKKTSRHHDRKK